MKSRTVRTSVDIPRDLHRRLREAALRNGCSARQLILAGIERAVEDRKPRRALRRIRLDPPLVPSTGKVIDLTNEQLYELLELP